MKKNIVLFTLFFFIFLVLTFPYSIILKNFINNASFNGLKINIENIHFKNINKIQFKNIRITINKKIYFFIKDGFIKFSLLFNKFSIYDNNRSFSINIIKKNKNHFEMKSEFDNFNNYVQAGNKKISFNLTGELFINLNKNIINAINGNIQGNAILQNFKMNFINADKIIIDSFYLKINKDKDIISLNFNPVEIFDTNYNLLIKLNEDIYQNNKVSVLFRSKFIKQDFSINLNKF